MAILGSGAKISESLEPCNFPQLNKAQVTQVMNFTASSQLSSEQTIQLDTFCEQRQIELPVLLQATWALVLRCYVGSDSVLFGYRKLESLNPGHLTICGDMFDATNAVEKHLERNTETRSNSSSSNCWAVTGEQHNESGQPLFNSLLTFRECGQSIDGDPQQTLNLLQYPILINFEKSNDVLLLKIKHTSSLLDEIQGQRIANTTRTAMLRISADPSISIGNLDLIDEQDLDRIWEWNHEVPEDSRICAHHLFERQARTTRNGQAICSWDGDMTYAELDRLSSVLGGYLSSKGIGPDMIVPICFEKCRWTIVAMMGVLKAGGAFATIDPAQPTNRLEATIRETNSKLVLAGSSQAGRFEGGDWEVLTNIPELCQRSDMPPYSSLSLSVEPSSLCYVAFTSGSTGKPKGVAHQHIGACSNMKLKARNGQDSGYGPGGRILQFASQAFAASVLEILKTLGSGGCICIPSESVRLNNIAQFMTENGITRAFFTPSLLKLFKPENLSTLQILLVGGEPVLPDLIEAWSNKLRLIEAIGMTEGVAIQTIIKSDGQMWRLGQTLSGVAWIVDPDDYNKLLPVGAIGELLIEGPCLAKGYLNDEEKTNAAFVEAPLWATKDKYPGRKFRLYRTGDLARYFNDGVVRLLGRKDNRVKLNGQRIELGDVEHHMQKGLPGSMVCAADVLTPSDSKEKAFLIGFIFASIELGKPNDPEAGEASESTRDRIALLVPDLKRQMAMLLPSYMIPTVFLPLERRPTNTSGKMDRKKLRQIASELSTEQLISFNNGTTQKTPPSTRMEKTVQFLWAKVFGIKADKIGLEDDFFMYGGDSLRAIKLVGLARVEGIRLTTGDILQNPTLQDMSLVAKILDKEILRPGTQKEVYFGFRREEIEELRALVPKYKIEKVAHATDLQGWATYTGLLRTRGWTDYLVFDFKGSLDVLRLEKACSMILTHFPIFRSVFVVHRRRAFQVVLKNYPVEFKQYEATGSGGIKAISKKLYDEDMARVVSLGEPIVRFMLVKQDSKNHRLLMRISHAQYDLFSLYMLFPAIKDAYNSLPLQPSPEFIDFVNSTKETEVQSEAYWHNLLKGSKMTQILPEPRPTYNNVEDKLVSRIIPLPSLQRYGVTIASVVLSAWSIVLSKLSGKSDVVFGNFVSGRHSTMVGVQEVVGPCMNINPVRTQFNQSMTVLDLLQQVQTHQLASLDHVNVGFRRIIEKCTNWPSWTRFSSIVNYVQIIDNPDTMFSIGDDLKFDFSVFKPATDKCDLWLQTKPKGNEMEVDLRFSGNVIPKALAEEALQLFCDVVQLDLSAVEAPLSSLIEGSAAEGAPQLSSSLPIMPSEEGIHCLIKAAWAKVLFAEGEDFDNANIEMSTPFYHVWGDLIGAAALCRVYREDGFDVCVEDIVDNPSMEMQLQLLALKRTHQRS